ncbi:MAG TPA: porin, partial [Kofleriaceae bacterium]|nr:porin [Kofleriaceae bacterium]
WEPYGYLRMQYIFVQNDPNVQFVGRDDGFELQNARIGVHGTMQGIASFTVSLDGAVDERAQNTPQGKLRVGMRDAYADITLAGELQARGGYFQTWVDPVALVPDTQREFVDKPLESRGMRSTEGWYTPGLPPGRSLGAAVRMAPTEPNHVGFELAVQNGADEFASNNDNDKPAVSAAAMLKLPNDGFLVAAGRWNPRTVGDLPFRQDETDLQGSVGGQVSIGPLVAGGGVMVQQTTFESTGGPKQNAFGGHAQAMVKVGATRPIAVGYRFGILDASSLITTDRVMEHTAGAVMAVPQFRMRVQLQFTHVQEQAARELSNDRLQLAAEVSL